MPLLRLTLMLGAAIYAGLVVASEHLPDAETPVDVARAAAGVDATAPLRAARSDVLLTQDGRTLEIAAVIDPSALWDGSEEIALVATGRQEAEAVTLTAGTSAGAPAMPLVEVTGNQVNLRAGPSTGDAVLGALVRGQQAELIAALGNGWVQIRAVETGVEGFMADRFLAPLN